MLKIAFVHNALTFYRIPLFNSLSTSKHYDIDFFFHKKYGFSKDKPSFSYKILLKSRFPFFPQDYTFAPFLFIHLLRNRYQIFIGAGAGYVDTWITFVISKLLHKPFILWDVSWHAKRPTGKNIRSLIIRYLTKHANAIVLPGLKARQYRLSLGVPSEKLFRSPNISILKNDDQVINQTYNIKKILNIMDDEKIILYFGKIISIKGIEYLIKAFNQLIKKEDVFARLIIASSLPGDEEYKYHLIELSNQLRLDNVSFIYLKTENEKAAVFNLADVFVLPSILTDKGPEIWGMVLNEAMSIGKPVIATNMVGGAYDLIKNGFNGYIVNEKDEDDLYKAIRNILLYPETKQKMGIRSLSIIEKKFKLEHAVSGFYNAIKNVIKNNDSFLS